MTTLSLSLRAYSSLHATWLAAQAVLASAGLALIPMGWQSPELLSLSAPLPDSPLLVGAIASGAVLRVCWFSVLLMALAPSVLRADRANRRWARAVAALELGRVALSLGLLAMASRWPGASLPHFGGDPGDDLWILLPTSLALGLLGLVLLRPAAR